MTAAGLRPFSFCSYVVVTLAGRVAAIVEEQVSV
jgi:hypothetical protein